MTQTLRGRRLSDAEFRALAAHALLHLDDVAWLEDSPLAELPVVVQRAAEDGKLFAGGTALQATLSEAARTVAEQLDDTGKLGCARALLDGVCAGKSIARIAREGGLTREHVSRSYWPFAVKLVVHQIATVAARPSVQYTGARTA